MDNNKIKIVTQNVRGLRDISKRKQLFLMMKKLNFHIILLQETHSTVTDEEEWKQQWGGDLLFSHGTNTARGVAVLFSPRTQVEVCKVERDGDGRWLMMEINIMNTDLKIGNIYVPNEDNPTFFKDVIEKLTQSDCTDICLGGDFNLVMNVDLDRLESKHNNKKVHDVLMEFIAAGYCDYWRACNPEKHQYTWFRGKSKVQKRQCARLEFFLVNDLLCSRVDSVLHKPGILSDHSMVQLELRSNLPSRGRGLWKMNTLFFVQLDFQEAMSVCLKKAIRKYDDCNPSLRWELIKTQVISLCQAYSWLKTGTDKTKTERLQNTIEYLEGQLNITQRQIFADELEAVKGQLETFIEARNLKYAFHSKAKYYSEGERNTKYFFNLAKARYCNRVMFEVEENGEKIVSPQGVLNAQYRFYTKLYKSNNSTNFGLVNTKGNKISTEEYNVLEADITAEELRSAVMHFKEDKTPGVDGIWLSFIKNIGMRLGLACWMHTMRVIKRGSCTFQPGGGYFL